MKVWRKVYCRGFQFVMRAALPFLPYRKPGIMDNVLLIPDLLKRKKCRSVLIVTDKSIRSAGLTRSLEKGLKDAGIHPILFDRTVPNPTTDIIDQAVHLYRRGRCSALIGFGGGSSIDCAKAVGVRIARPKKTLGQMAGILKVILPIPLLIAVPTTAGTGSETTLASVVTDSVTRHKYAINDFPLIPKYAVLDPELTRNLPRSLTATTGMDALTHAVEAYIGRSTTSETREEAISAVRLIHENLEKAYKDGNDMKARKNMLRAAFLAGDAFSQSYVGYVHAVAHSLGGKYDVPHGLANAVILPYFLEGYGSSVYKKLATLAHTCGLSEEGDSESEAAKKFIKEVRRMNESMGIGESIPELKEEDIPELAAKADKEANPLYPVPVLMDEYKLREFYYKILQA